MRSHNDKIPAREDCLAGRDVAIPVAGKNLVTGNEMCPPFADNLEVATFAMGCFWGAERRFWEQNGVVSTAVGYAGGHTPNPSYEEVCTGLTGHTEVVLVIFDPDQTSFASLLSVFWESHDPTQGMRQGNDVGTQYRSAVYCSSQFQFDTALKTSSNVQGQLNALGLGKITTEIELAPEFFYAEDYHQQYLIKNPNGYCGLKGTGICCE